VSISWTSHGERNYVLGRCLDISERGIGLELPKSLPLGAEVTLHADWLSLDGGATLRRQVRRAGVYVLGLEFEVPLREEILQSLLASPEPARTEDSSTLTAAPS
jgi:hypothetical protein